GAEGDLVGAGQEGIGADLVQVLAHQVFDDVALVPCPHRLPTTVDPCPRVVGCRPRSWYPPACWACGAITWGRRPARRRSRPCGPAAPASCRSAPRRPAGSRHRGRRPTCRRTAPCLPPKGPTSA